MSTSPSDYFIGGLLHWTQTSSETSASLAVEISSYVLLAFLSASPLSTTDLGYVSHIVRVFSREGTSTVTVRSPSGGQHLFNVNQNNKLLYQERALQDTEGKYSVEVKGSACASVQMALHYNIPTPTDSTTLRLTVKEERAREEATLKMEALQAAKDLQLSTLREQEQKTKSLFREGGAAGGPQEKESWMY
ncbi:hypothetical protein J4Q44_G00385890 [Coregonus suidteri]|uniref:Uncharacterized protein n=1 Tax=Coregonus suidteri TaxID=861788 RepID=A0AAN8KG00_9TELE